ncbi:MAG: phage tail protein [Campylobacteraceae bacterium]|jgi:phage protein D|nr:phage tail protein [Campylobacteraceae bacterium]
MVIKPSFKLIADNRDITQKIAKNLISLSYDDKENLQSDEISFTLAGLYEKKPFGTKLELHLGYEGKLFLCGAFSVQTITKNYVEKTTEVRATAVNFATAQKERKSRNWNNTNLENIVKTIAEEEKLDFDIPASAKECAIASELQNNTPNMAFLTLLGYKFGFRIFQKNNTIYVRDKSVKIDEVRTIGSTNALTIKKLALDSLYSLEITDANRNVYDAVIVEWKDKNEGVIKELKIGSGTTQIYKMRISEPKSDTEAIKIGEAKLRDLQSGGVTGNLETQGQEFRVGQKFKINEINREFTAISISHSFDGSGYKISVEFEG